MYWSLLLCVAWCLVSPLECMTMQDTCTYSEGVVRCAAKDLPRNYGNNSVPVWAWADSMMDAVEADFSGNSIVRVYGFPKLRLLQKLDLSHNNIQEIDVEAFVHLQNLTELDLGENFITTKELRPDIFKAPKTRSTGAAATLSSSTAHILVGEYLAGEYLPLKNMKLLRLRANELYSLDPDVFEHIEHLEELDLSKNAFDMIDPNTLTAISSLGQLKRLDLSFNSLSTLPDGLLHTLKDLEGLLLTGNKFVCPPADLKNSHEIQLLSLDDNPIVAINSSCGFPESLSRLHHLTLNDMRLLEVIDARAMETLKELHILEIRNNPRLSTIHGEFPSTLQEVYLNHNNLSRLEGSQVLGRLDQLHTVDLSANPWLCDCESQWLLDVIVPIINHTHPTYLDTISCHAPPVMAGLTLASLEVRHYHMRCLDALGNRPERDAAMLTGVLVGLLLGLAAVGLLLALHRRGLLPAWVRCETGPAAFSRGFYSKAGSNNDDI